MTPPGRRAQQCTHVNRSGKWSRLLVSATHSLTLRILWWSISRRVITRFASPSLMSRMSNTDLTTDFDPSSWVSVMDADTPLPAGLDNLVMPRAMAG